MEAYAIKGDVKITPNSKIDKAKTIVSTSNKPYAYILPWKGIKDLRFLAYLFKNDIIARVSMESFTLDEKSYDPGTLVITRKGNEKQGINFDNVIQNGAKIFNRSLTPASSGFVSKGKDFGSSSMKVIK